MLDVQLPIPVNEGSVPLNIQAIPADPSRNIIRVQCLLPREYTYFDLIDKIAEVGRLDRQKLIIYTYNNAKVRKVINPGNMYLLKSIYYGIPVA